MSDKLLSAIKHLGERAVYTQNHCARQLASECATQEEKLLKLRIVSNMTIDRLTELLLQGYTLVPPAPSDLIRPVRCGECVSRGAAFCMLGDSYNPQTDAKKYCSEGAAK